MKFYICPECEAMTTDEAINDECENGGMGMCDCRYVVFEWDEKYDGFEPVYMREYIPWEEIPERIYNLLKGDSNTMLRLRNYRQIPRSVLDECKPLCPPVEKDITTFEMVTEAVRIGTQELEGDFPTEEELEELMVGLNEYK